VADVCDQVRHEQLLERQERLKAHPWHYHMQMMSLAIPAMLEVGRMNVGSDQANRSHQQQCKRCAHTNNPCYTKERWGKLPHGLKVRCEHCRAAKKSCSWGDQIPAYLYGLKWAMGGVADIPEGMADPIDVFDTADVTLEEQEPEVDHRTASEPGPAAAEMCDALNLSPEGLDRMWAATVAGIAELDTRLEILRDEEVAKLCEAVQGMRM